jgi:hypothetical protein
VIGVDSDNESIQTGQRRSMPVVSASGRQSSSSRLLATDV